MPGGSRPRPRAGPGVVRHLADPVRREPASLLSRASILARLPQGAGGEARGRRYRDPCRPLEHGGRASGSSGSATQVDLPPPTLCTLLRMRGWTWNGPRPSSTRWIPTGVILPKSETRVGAGRSSSCPTTRTTLSLDGEAHAGPASRHFDLPAPFRSRHNHMEARNLLAILALSRRPRSACSKDESQTGRRRASRKRRRVNRESDSGAEPPCPTTRPKRAGSVLRKVCSRGSIPDAVAVAWVDMPARRSTTTRYRSCSRCRPSSRSCLATFDDIEEGLDAIRPLEAPHPDEWLGNQASFGLGRPRVHGDLRACGPVTKPRAEVEKMLLGSREWRRPQIEGFTILIPQNAFGWKVAFLTDDVVAFIPSKEVGHWPQSADRRTRHAAPVKSRDRSAPPSTTKPAWPSRRTLQARCCITTWARTFCRSRCRLASGRASGLDVAVRLLAQCRRHARRSTN